MFVSTSVRLANVNVRKMIRCPVKGGAKLTGSPMVVFIKKNYPAKAGKPMEAIAKLRGKWAKLNTAARAPYVRVASQNAKEVQKRRAIVNTLNVHAYGLFIKKNFAAAAQNAKGTGIKKCQQAFKALSKRWASASAAEKTKYSKEAAKMRATAQKQVNVMLKKYSA